MADQRQAKCKESLKIPFSELEKITFKKGYQPRDCTDYYYHKVDKKIYGWYWGSEPKCWTNKTAEIDINHTQFSLVSDSESVDDYWKKQLTSRKPERSRMLELQSGRVSKKSEFSSCVSESEKSTTKSYESPSKNPEKKSKQNPESSSCVSESEESTTSPQKILTEKPERTSKNHIKKKKPKKKPKENSESSSYESEESIPVPQKILTEKPEVLPERTSKNHIKKKKPKKKRRQMDSDTSCMSACAIL
jgi:hypothetical protein